ncbi:predicted protein [Nematostella vectensis]|uniref:Bcl-2 Bcl-2 homology region 1-3 domain-containing protein n=1 Tax=Nematostella vectensis TaxID=45351 RepID=A7S9S4_NEMVE|nr:predicted protein [Nematostella vectensis]|eukprot:XP_001631594.1 predicted protein [Nematostella vectensis]
MAALQAQRKPCSETLETLNRQAHFLAQDLISYRTGNGRISTSLTARNMRRLSDELEERHGPLLCNMCNSLNMTANSAHEKFVQVADEVFKDGINWGRIVAVFTFGGRLAQFCARNGLHDGVREVEAWLGDYIANLSHWIQTQGGWVCTFETSQSHDSANFARF